MDDRAMTWASLLAGWMELARASRALGRDGDDAAWKASIAPIITLHAVACALGELDRLDGAERLLALDRAAILIRRGEHELSSAWRERETPTEIARLIDDARAALEAVSRRWRSNL